MNILTSAPVTQETTLSALVIFSPHIPPGIVNTTVTLKYPFKGPDGSVIYWAGLGAARRSSEMWIALLSEGGSIPEIGVQFIAEEENTAQRFKMPFTPRTSGTPSVMYFALGEGVEWAPGTVPVSITPPSTYQVRSLLSKVRSDRLTRLCEGVYRSGLSAGECDTPVYRSL